MQRAYQNPVHPSYFADPFVWRAESCYFAIGTGEAEARGAVRQHTAHEPSIFPLLQSADLVHWQDIGPALVQPDPALGDTFWAPEVAFADGTWLLYYSVGWDDRLHQLRVARSTNPRGPYVDVTGLTNREQCAFAIDPHPFRDHDGRWYLFHARDFLTTTDEAGNAVRPGTALVVHALESMTSLASSGIVVARARHDWQRFAANRPMYGAVFDWHTLEGPFVVRHDGRYFCFYSGGCWQTDTYGVDYVVADSVLGPWSDAGAEAGPRVLRTAPGKVVGPGHCSIVGAAGRYFIVYHAWSPDMSARRMYIDELVFTRDGPRSRGPMWTEQRLHAAD